MLESYHGVFTSDASLKSASQKSVLYQNFPNPTSGSTMINYEIIAHFSNASIAIYSMMGNLLTNTKLHQKEKDL